ncbi:MAG: V-type ATPase subunit [Anaerolineae bacterium]|jgi:V/A-type H+-transporting ATPase subunit C
MGGGDVSEYAAIHARVRAMYATLLSPETWRELCEALDLAALVGLLKETAYGPYIAEVEDSRLTPRRAAYQIRKHLAAAFTAIVQLAPAPTRSLVNRLCRRYEVDDLKALLRGIETGTPWEQVNFVLFPLGAFTELPGREMVEAESVAAAVELLRGTSYYDTLSHAMKRYAEEQSLFPLEVALDLAYWRDLWRSVGQLSNASRMPGRRVVGSLLDANNLMWAIRYRVNHRLSEEEIINYTLPFGYRVRDEDIRAIAAGADIASIVSRIYPEVGDVAPLLREPQSGIPELEVRLQRYNAGVYRNAFLGYPFHIGVPAAYLLLAEMEIQDLTMLLETKSAQLPPERFQPHLLVGWLSEQC